MENKNDLKKQTIEIPEDWGMYMQSLDDKPALTRTNLALYPLAPIAEYKYRLQLAVYYQNETENGLPIQEENPLLWKIEDRFIEILKESDAIDAGLMKWNNRVNFFFYVKDAAGMEDLFVNGLKKDFPDYEYKLWVDLDEEWECYLETLYPDKYSMQEIQNNKVLQALQNDNDNLAEERTIEHFIWFKDEQSADDFIAKTEKEGFKVFLREVREDDEYPYQVGVSRVDIPDDIHGITWLLLDAAEECGGDYDGWECTLVK